MGRNCLSSGRLKASKSWICKKYWIRLLIYASEPWTLLILPLSRFRNREKSSLSFVFVGRIDKPCFKFRSPYIPLAGFDCFGFECLSEEPSVFLASRSFVRDWIVVNFEASDIAWHQCVKPWWLKVEAIVGWTETKVEENIYLLLTEFEGRKLSYGPSFFPLFPFGKKRGSVTYSTDRENEISKIFIISLLCVWRAHERFLYSRGTASNFWRTLKAKSSQFEIGFKSLDAL